MKGNSALQSGLLRRIYVDGATLNRQPAVCIFLDMDKFYDSVCLHKLFDQTLERLLYMAMHSYFSERLFREGEMVGQSIQLSNGIQACCSLGNMFARVVLYNILECGNNVLPTQPLAPVETRQFVNDLTTMSVANSEDDVDHSICSVALELPDELRNARLTLRKNKLEVNDCEQPQRPGEEGSKNPQGQRSPHPFGLGIVVTSGTKRRRKIRYQRLRAAKRQGIKG